MYLNKSVFRLFAVVYLLSLALSSCSPRPLRGLERSITSDQTLSGALIEIQKSEMLKYRCKLEAFDQKITGVLIVKQMISEARAVIITDFGLQVIDISFDTNGIYHINHIMRHLDYDFIKESLAQNILMLLNHRLVIGDRVFEKENSQLIYLSNLNMIYYQRNDSIYRTERYRGKSKLIAYAELKKNAIIEVSQLNPKMSMILKPID